TFDATTAKTGLMLVDGQLDPTQILLRGESPCLAVLLSCETAVRMTGQRPHLSLIDALLAAGADAVVATASRIEDRMAQELTESLVLDTSEDIEMSLRRALMTLESKYPGLTSEIQFWGTTAP
ncbi:MAG: CHAT domain-containing protein, partial [Myxococcota bacterium]